MKLTNNSAKIFLSSFYRTCSFTQQKESKMVPSECFSLLDFKVVLKILPRTTQSHENLESQNGLGWKGP